MCRDSLVARVLVEQRSRQQIAAEVGNVLPAAFREALGAVNAAHDDQQQLAV
jgi:hypothetical protein